MPLYNVTPVPNALFDTHLPTLKPAELKVILVIIRQTLGWFDQATNQRKKWDWISHSQFKTKTGLSNKAVSSAVESLVSRDLIRASDRAGNLLSTPEARRNASAIFYCLDESASDSTPIIR